MGYAVVLIASYVDLFYNVILAWSLRYFFSSFTSQLPWTNCNNTWNTEHCLEVSISVQYGGLLFSAGLWVPCVATGHACRYVCAFLKMG